MNHADRIEEFIDHLLIKYAHWLFAGNFDEKKNEIIVEFVNWVIAEEKEALHDKRGNGISFFEIREKERADNQAGKTLDDQSGS